MIIKESPEMLTSLIGTKRIDEAGGLDALIQRADEIQNTFSNVVLNEESLRPMYMRADSEGPKLVYADKNGSFGTADITSYAFNQACNTWGIPSKYLEKLYGTEDLAPLADMNISELIRHQDRNEVYGGRKLITSEGVVEAIVSDRFCQEMPTNKVLRTIKNHVDLTDFTPNFFYLSKQKLHIRFIDFDHPEDVGGEKMSVGFTVDTSDLGKSALKVRFFIYKFACKNGIVRAGGSGKLFEQKHIGTFGFSELRGFIDSFTKVADLRDESFMKIMAAQKKTMSIEDVNRLIDASRSAGFTVGDKERQNIIDLASERYARPDGQVSFWGAINGFTEVAQNHTLEDRLAYEAFAGRMLMTA